MSTPSEWIAEKEALLKEKEASATLISALRTQIEELQRDIRSAAQSAEPPVSGAVPEESKKLREQLDEQSKQHAEFVKTLSAQADTLRAELQRTKDASSSLSASHAEEMRALQTRLQAEHSKAIEELRATKVAENKDVDPAALEAIIQSRLADINKDATSQISKLREEIEALRKERDDAKNQGIEQGRKEMGMKLKLKDSQYAKTAKRLQEVEAALANFQPPTPSTASASIVSQGGNSAPVIAAPSAPSAETNTVVSPAAPVVPLATSTPVEGAHGSSTVNTGSPVARRGRGVSLRGAATRGRGGRAAPAGAVAAAGTSILGAAAKRPRESETDTPDDSLVKRLKPANPPITLNRNRPLPPDSSSSTS
ncbi:hypothetical protein SISNIDRAFT_104359 [Sistotremastrum niveocremeum HHB9708]|uniref:Uncharacterized protein n=1 Tax=Sistotremastrum niveocremeum HHB9708 TaxID=1314777 RepID=A0A164UGJ4_9AGAM|nr:hypothetical protein SISNIDRAFT_104359 [Sistotremastrum niveocremeum HHB9708]